MAEVVCMASAKGGSGKTVLTATFGSLIASIGLKVLLVDTDAATNGLSLLYLEELVRTRSASPTRPLGLYEGGLTRIRLDTGADLLPATYEFQNTDSVAFAEYAKTFRIAIDELRPAYDYILLDAQAGSDSHAQLSMSQQVSDTVVIVTEYDPLSAAGIERLKAIFREELAFSRTWILVNKMLPEFVQSFSQFLEVAKYLPPVPWDADVVRAYARRKLALDLENGNEYTLAVVATLRTLLGPSREAKFAHWLEGRALTIREPLSLQIEDVRTQMRAVNRQIQDVDRQMRMRTRRIIYAASAIAAGAVTILIAAATSFPSPGLVISVCSAIAAGAVVGGVILSFQDSASLVAVRGKLAAHADLLQERLERLQVLERADAAELIGRRDEIIAEIGGAT